jgi:adenosylhomocysteine nucleosidase
MMDQAGEVVVLISADAEWRAVKALFNTSEDYQSPYGDWFQTRINVPAVASESRSETLLPASPLIDISRRVLFFHGGWGKIAAAASTQYIIDRWKPRLLINLGTCGGFEGQVEQGEVILANQTIVYDIIELMGDFDEHIDHYSTALEMDWLNDAKLPFPVRKTLLVSGDRDLLASEIPELHARYGAVAGDWESGAIAWVASRNRTRLLILRGVSDVVRSAGSEAYGNLDYFARSTERILGQLIGALPACLAQAFPAGE